MTTTRSPSNAPATRIGDVDVVSLFGDEVSAAIPDVARLRIEVFREFPYLYDGSLAYEEEYLRTYASSEEALVVVARHGDEVVGVSTAMPATLHHDSIAPVLEAAGFDPAKVYYFGESVLRRDFRGRGLGHAFFDHREAAARRFGRFTHTAFCAVVRPADHPARPLDYVPNDAFWTRRGYVKRPDVVAHFAWKEIGASEQTDQPMVFWFRALEP